MNIIGLFPLTGNGGIASWTKKFRTTFPDEEFKFEFVNVTSVNNKIANKFTRYVIGLYGMLRVLRDVWKAINKSQYNILHTTTSGDIGHLRDYYIAKMSHYYGLKCIMHCRYGSIPNDIVRTDFVGRIMRKAMNEFDQIWVLDKKSYKALIESSAIRSEVYLTPNSIDVKENLDAAPRDYHSIAFCGNVYPTKGVLELVKGVLETNVTLHIIGPASKTMIEDIKRIAGNEIDKRVILHGRMSNEKAVEYLKNVDMIALPTYYKKEAFPISIIEAMSLSKLVISCDRAAIPDMLTALDGSMCGLLVEPKSSDAIRDAINWCQNNKKEADNMRTKAYNKVYKTYRKEVVYELYRENYRRLISK